MFHTIYYIVTIIDSQTQEKKLIEYLECVTTEDKERVGHSSCPQRACILIGKAGKNQIVTISRDEYSIGIATQSTVMRERIV